MAVLLALRAQLDIALPGSQLALIHAYAAQSTSQPGRRARLAELRAEGLLTDAALLDLAAVGASVPAPAHGATGTQIVQRSSNVEPSVPNRWNPRRWLLKNTDTFAGFAHAINTYLAGVTLAHTHGFGLIHRPQPMAHSLAYTFEDFFALDPRGAVPPIVMPTLDADQTAMLIDGHRVRLDVIAGGATHNSSLLGMRMAASPPDTLVWLRKGRSSIPLDCAQCTTNVEVRITQPKFSHMSSTHAQTPRLAHAITSTPGALCCAMAARKILAGSPGQAAAGRYAAGQEISLSKAR